MTISRAYQSYVGIDSLILEFLIGRPLQDTRMVQSCKILALETDFWDCLSVFSIRNIRIGVSTTDYLSEFKSLGNMVFNIFTILYGFYYP